MFYPKNDNFEFDLSDEKSYMNPPEKEDDFKNPELSKSQTGERLPVKQ